MKTHNIRKAIACCLLALGAITAISQESQPVDPIVVKLDRSQSPPQIDILGTEGDLKGKVEQGIFSIAGDKLKICHTLPGKNRPTAFESAAGSEAHFIVWKRQMP